MISSHLQLLYCLKYIQFSWWSARHNFAYLFHTIVDMILTETSRYMNHSVVNAVGSHITRSIITWCNIEHSNCKGELWRSRASYGHRLINGADRVITWPHRIVSYPYRPNDTKAQHLSCMILTILNFIVARFPVCQALRSLKKCIYPGHIYICIYIYMAYHGLALTHRYVISWHLKKSCTISACDEANKNL